jgi:hypothetical protein
MQYSVPSGEALRKQANSVRNKGGRFWSSSFGTGKIENRGQIIMLSLRPATSSTKFSTSYKKEDLFFSRLGLYVGNFELYLLLVALRTNPPF